MQATLTTETTASVITVRAPRVLFGALLLGLVTQLLFYRAGLGLDWLVWDLVIVAVTIRVLGRGPLKAPAIMASVTAVLLGAAFVFHRSEFTTVVALLANVAVLAALPIILYEDLSFAELGRLPVRALDAFVRVPFAAVATALLPRDALHVLDGGERSTAKRAVAGLFLGLPISGLFTMLLCGDAGFASVIGRIETRLDSVATFALRAAITATFFAFCHGLFGHRAARLQTFVEVVAPYRSGEGEEPKRARVSPLTWGIVLAQVAMVFLLYAVVHRDTEFGGHAMVRGREGITYASNLHAGFYQLLLATMLSVGLVVVGHHLMSGEEERVPGGARLTAVEAAVLVLTGVALYSCAHRLRLYEEAYGATLLRLGVAFVVLGAFVVLATTLVKSLFRGFRLFAPVTMTALTAVVVTAAWFDADGYVARRNVARAHLDVAYLASLSPDACVVLSTNDAKLTPEVRAQLVAAWREPRPRDVRALRGFHRCP